MLPVLSITLVLAKILGIYLIIVNLFMLICLRQFQERIQAVVENESLLWISSFFTLIFGIVLIVLHNVWVLGWPVIITIIAWIVFIKGLINVWDPRISATWALNVQRKEVIYTTSVIGLIIGFLLLLKGLLVF